MQLRRLGNSEIEVSAVGMGCWAIVGDSTWGSQDDSDTSEAIRAAMNAGINFFDTAEAYGDGYSEELLAKAFKGIRDRVVIASKASPNHHAPADLKKACEDSLRRLNTDYLDLYQLHWPSRAVGFEETWAMMEQLIGEGKVRVAGVSNFGAEDLSALLETGKPASNQLCYNLLFRAIEFEIQPLCVENEVSIICYSPIMQGLLTGKFASPDDVPEGRARTRHFSKDRPQSRHTEEGAEEETFAALDRIRDISRNIGAEMVDVALAWLLHRPAVATVISGIRNARQAAENARAATLDLDPRTVEELTRATEALKEKLGGNADMWQTQSRIR